MHPKVNQNSVSSLSENTLKTLYLASQQVLQNLWIVAKRVGDDEEEER